MPITWKDFLPPVITNLWTPQLQSNNRWFYKFLSSGQDIWKVVELLKAWNDIPELSSVICMKGHMVSNGIFKSVDDNGDEKIIPESRALLDLLNNPNWMQGRNEFIEQTEIFGELFGNEFLYVQKPFGINRAQQIFTLPLNIIKAEYVSKIPFFENDGVNSVVYSYKNANGKYVELKQSQVIHLNDNRINIKSATDKSLILGESKYSSLKAQLNNIRGAYESRGVIIRRRGALGILSNEAKDVAGNIPLREDDRNQLQNEYRKYGGLENQDQLIISPVALKWQQMSVNPDKLGLFQEIEESFNKILDVAGLASEIFVRSKGSTYENQKQAEKGTYIRTIIPEANIRCAALNNYFLKGSGVRIIASFDHLYIFQEDLKAKADSLGAAVNAMSVALADGAINIEQYQDELNKYGVKKSSK